MSQIPSGRCFLFKPDGIGDFFLASGVIRLLAQEYGEEHLTIATHSLMESVVKGQFPRASVIILPLQTRRVFLNLFVANSLRCFFPWLRLLRTQADTSISLRHMRDYLQTILFCSVRSSKRFACPNLLLGNGRPVRRWTEKVFTNLFSLRLSEYPNSTPGIPSELEAHRRLVSEALERKVTLEEIWPVLRSCGKSTIETPFWVCAPFSSSAEKDFPPERWVALFYALHQAGKLPHLILTGSSNQKKRLDQFQNLFSKTSQELGQKTQIIIPENLQEFIDLLAGAECVTTVDTAAAHAATALNCRTLILFSGKHQGMFAPWVRSSRQHWLLPEAASSSSCWYANHTTEDLLKQLEAIFLAHPTD
jgi:ADP-heptose:LPS heptosyltransferase